MIISVGLRRTVRFPRRLAAVLLIALAPLGAGAAAVQPLLTTAAQVRALTEEEARRAPSVRLRGVFMGEADPEGIAFVIQDDTDGIYIQGPAELVAELSRGDLLEIEGITDPGGFAPYVVARSIRKVGRGRIPEPIPVSLDELNAGQLDAKWIEISGIVRSIEPNAPTDKGPPPPGTRYAAPAAGASRPKPQKVKIKLASGSARVVVELTGGFDPEAYIDAEVRLRGLCFNLHNPNRQFVRPFVQVPRGVEVVVVRPAPAKPFDRRPRSVASLLQFDPTGKHGHRVHVRGVVLHHQPDAVLWVRDGDRSLRVDTAHGETLRPGDEVDVLGFPSLGNYSAVLEDAVYRKLSTQPPPLPRVLSDVTSAVRHDADLVQLEARLREVREFSNNVSLDLEWRQKSIRAQLQLPEGVRTPADWQPGSTVRVAGVCAVVTDESGPLGGLWEPRSFELLLRSPADLTVLQPPPWWNAERVVWVLSGSLALAMGAVAVVMSASRRRLKEQEQRRAMAEAEFVAILSERNRVAREIHDTLSQSLSAIAVQLELVRTHAGEIGAAARHHLAAAHQLARGALADARESIWNMRSHVLERGDLAAALEGILVQMTADTGVAPDMQVEGERRRLPPVAENNLLRIGQEAITNACKHAKPAHITVTLAFDARTVRLVVADDGVGFATTAPPSPDRRSFGLVGIRERAELLGGTAEIESAPGRGTRIVVTVPV